MKTYHANDCVGTVPFYKTIEVNADTIDEAARLLGAIQCIKVYEAFPVHPGGIVFRLEEDADPGTRREKRYIELARDSAHVCRWGGSWD